MAIKLRKVGGIHFLRIGSLQFSFCRVKKQAPRALPGTVYPAFTAKQAAAYSNAWTAHCDTMSAGY